MDDDKRHEKLAGEIFMLLFQGEDRVRLSVWITMLEQEILRQRGHEDGEAAAQWLVDGNTADPFNVLQKIILGIDDGDPAILDQLPQPRIGGEFADDQSWADILNIELNHRCEVYSSDDGELVEAYNEGWGEGVEDGVRKMLHDYDPATNFGHY